MSFDLTDRVILITGASSGIGAATALACAQAGMHVALAARRTDGLEQVATRVRALGRRALALHCDVNQDSDVHRAVDDTFREFGRLDVVFANAGYGLYADILGTTDRQMRDIFETNFHGTLRVIRAAAPLMLKKDADARGWRGHVVICSSAASKVGLPMYGAYSASKAAQDSIASALRGELANRGVYVTSVHPIGTVTEFADRVRALAGEPAVRSNTPRLFRQSAEHVARCIVKALRRPKPEVWPHRLMRLGIALGVVFPRFTAWAMRRHMRRL